MCDTHLVPDVDELRQASLDLVCQECNEPVKAGESYRYIEGVLDDGSPERWIYEAHDDCYMYTALEPDEDGCFQYGGIKKVEATHAK